MNFFFRCHSIISRGIFHLRQRGLKSFSARVYEYVLAKSRRRHSISSNGSPVEQYHVHNDHVGYSVVRSMPIMAGEDLLVFLIYSPDGFLSRIQKMQLRRYKQAGFKLALIVNTPMWRHGAGIAQEAECLYDVNFIMYRENIGFDFGGWAHFLMVSGGFDSVNTVSFTNDSIVPTPNGRIDKLRERIRSVRGAFFLTENLELKPHGQSYFFGFSGKHLKNVERHLRDVPNHREKWGAIFNEEIHMSDRFSSSGLEVEFLFNVKSNPEIARDKTIKDWQELIEVGFPFIKVQLFSSGILAADDCNVLEIIGEGISRDLQEHLSQRHEEPLLDPRKSDEVIVKCISDVNLFDSRGVLQARNFSKHYRPPIGVPLVGIHSVQPRPTRVLVIFHAFYVQKAIEMINELIECFAQIENLQYDLIVSTDSRKKANELEGRIGQRSGMRQLVIDTFENRGRNVLPFLKLAEKYTLDQDLILHLHTKKSTHDPSLERWGEFLFRCLVGSPDIVRSIFHIMEQRRVGLLYPINIDYLNKAMNWGYDFDQARSLLGRLDVHIDGAAVLEFPAGMMFWANPNAIKELFEFGSSDLFDEEEGQTDGTFAHSIERSIIFLIEARGFTARSLVSTPVDKLYSGPVLELGVKNVAAEINHISARLNSVAWPSERFEKNVPEVYGVTTGFSDVKRMRLNIILPSVEPFQIYGGVATAIKHGLEFWRAFEGDVDLRFIITLDRTSLSGLQELSRRIGHAVMRCRVEDDVEGVSLVCLRGSQFLPLSLRENDLFFATAWWTADLGFRLCEWQKNVFGKSKKLIYFIQDFEPGFYNFCEKYVLAERTYSRGKDTLAIVNSEELCNFFVKKYSFDRTFVVPYVLEEDLVEVGGTISKERIILIYARPSVSRNLFLLAMEAVRKWQVSDPISASGWQILLVGEDLEPSLVSDIHNVEVLGKLSLGEYKKVLSRAYMGISLMLSVHPSYPPLEMACFGVKTITNRWSSKVMSSRSDSIFEVHDVSVESIVSEIMKLVLDFEVRDKVFESRGINPVSCDAPNVDYHAIVSDLRGDGMLGIGNDPFVQKK